MFKSPLIFILYGVKLAYKRTIEELREIERLKPMLEKVRVEDVVKGIREDREGK